jgi:hypothetical protein
MYQCPKNKLEQEKPQPAVRIEPAAGRSGLGFLRGFLIRTSLGRKLGRIVSARRASVNQLRKVIPMSPVARYISTAGALRSGGLAHPEKGLDLADMK